MTSDTSRARVTPIGFFFSIMVVVCGVVMTPFSAVAQLTTNVIEAPAHHLGDSPGNEGTVFQKAFTIPLAFTNATLEFDFIAPTGPNLERPPLVSINGSFAGSVQPFFPPLSTNSCWQTNPDSSHDYNCKFHVSLPVTSLLVAGTNTFRIENGRPDDDYIFANVKVVLVLSLPLPQLTIIPSGANVILTWPANAARFTLQSTTNLAPPAVWITNSPASVVVNGQNTVTNSVSGAQKFYRLSQ